MAYLTPQVIYTYVGSPTIATLFSDIALEQPNLLTPEDSQVICKFVGNTFNLTWQAVPNATFYIVHICKNSQFVGPSLQAIKTASLSTTLTVGADGEDKIVYGLTYYWRVFAFNTSGGAGPKSVVREFKIQCKYGRNPTDPDCESLHTSVDLFAPGPSECNQQLTVTAAWSANTPPKRIDWTVQGNAVINSYTNNSVKITPFGCRNQRLVVKICLVFEGPTSGSGDDFSCCKEVNIDIVCTRDSNVYPPYTTYFDIIKPTSMSLSANSAGLYLNWLYERYAILKNYCNDITDVKAGYGTYAKYTYVPAWNC
jgi:hypothetical protein